MAKATKKTTTKAAPAIGRTPKRPGRSANVTVALRISQADVDRLNRLVERRGMTMGHWIREAMLAGFREVSK